MPIRRSTGLIVAVALLVVPALPAQEAEPAAARLYVAFFATGAGWIRGAPPGEQPGIGEHVAFITGLNTADTVPLGGPLFADDERGEIAGILYFIRAESREEAREIALREPMLRTEVVQLVSVREFLVGVGHGRLD